MPCSDVTEIIEVVVDGADRLKRYRLAKRTCGQGVGHESLLADWLTGQPANELLALAPETFLEAHGITDDLERFLTLKHLFALQAALRVLLGDAPGGPEDACAAAAVYADGDDLVLDGRIAVDIVTDQIRSCGGCKGCGTAKTKQSA